MISSGRKGSRSGFDRVPSAAWNHFDRIGRGGYALLGALANHADKAGKCYPGLKRLAAMVYCSPRHVRRLLRILESCQLIRVFPRAGRSSVYQLSWGSDFPVRSDDSVRTREQPVKSGRPDKGEVETRLPMSAKPDLLEPDLPNAVEEEALRRAKQHAFAIVRERTPESIGSEDMPDLLRGIEDADEIDCVRWVLGHYLDDAAVSAFEQREEIRNAQ